MPYNLDLEYRIDHSTAKLGDVNKEEDVWWSWLSDQW